MKATFEIKKKTIPTPAQGFAQLVGNSKDNQIVEIPLDMIDEIDNQPHKIHEEQIENIAQSIAVAGQIDPVIVVDSPESEGRYILLSGRHRVRACKLLKQNTVKAVIITETDPDKQRFILLSSNNDRNTNYLPSEVAYAYLEQKQLFERLGSKQVTAKIAQYNGTNRKSVHKFIQLTKLTKPLLYKVDKGELTVGAGYELSYLDTKAQEGVNIYLINNPNTHITKETARLIRENPKDIDIIIRTNSQEKSSTPPQEEIKEQKPKKTRSESQDVSDDVFNKSEKLFIAHTIYRWKKQSIDNLIIKRFASTEDVVAFLHNVCLQAINNTFRITFNKYIDERISVTFFRNRCCVEFYKKRCYFSLKEVDTLLREYINTCLSEEEIISIIKNNK